MSYYRLKMVDIDNSFTYSPIRLVQLKGGNIKVMAYPSPISHTLNIEVSDQKPLEFTLTDLLGRFILRGPLKDAQNSIDLQTLINGVYHLSIFDKQGGVVHAQNVLVQK